MLVFSSTIRPPPFAYAEEWGTRQFLEPRSLSRAPQAAIFLA